MLSNLYKSGFQNLSVKQGEVYVFDANKKKIDLSVENTGKIIRPLEEKSDEAEAGDSSQVNEILLNEAMDKAKSLHEDARVRAAQIISDAENTAADIREQARHEGYEQGLQEGNTEAMKRADDYLADIHAKQEKQLALDRQQMEEQLKETEREVVDLACKLIYKLTGMLVDDYKPVMLHMINESLAKSDTSKKFVIHVSDELYSYIEDNKSRLIGDSNPGIEIEIYGDSKLDRRNCQIDTDNGIIDLSMDVQVRNLITAIKLLSD